MPFLTAHSGICGKTPGAKERVPQHRLHLFPASCNRASRTRVQMRLRQWEQKWQGLCIDVLCSHSEQLRRPWSPELHAFPWLRDPGYRVKQWRNSVWAIYFYKLNFPPLALYWEVLSLWVRADKQPDFRSQVRFGLGTCDVFIAENRRQFGWPGDRMRFSRFTKLGCELFEGETAAEVYVSSWVQPSAWHTLVLWTCWRRRAWVTGHHWQCCIPSLCFSLERQVLLLLIHCSEYTSPHPCLFWVYLFRSSHLTVSGTALRQLQPSPRSSCLSYEITPFGTHPWGPGQGRTRF